MTRLRKCVIALSVAVAAAVPFTPVVPASGDVQPVTVCQQSADPGGLAVQAAQVAYAHKGWKHGPDQNWLVTAYSHAACLSATPAAQQDVYGEIKALQDSFATYHAYRKIAHYRGFRGEGEYLEWLPIPRYIVACETNGYHGDGRWRARNSSGAQGPAQLLGWPAPYPAMSDHERLRYWQVTLQVWRGSGSGAWACA